jgi:hypothetical protein
MSLPRTTARVLVTGASIAGTLSLSLLLLGLLAGPA